MNEAFYQGASGLRAQQQAMNIIGQNIANVNTHGYQKQNVSFQDLLHREMYTNAQGQPLTGAGVKNVDAGLTIGKGALKGTNSSLDFAIAGEGFFAVDNNGTIQYTRDGAFSIGMEGEKGYLTTLDGKYVLDKNKAKIEIEREKVKPSGDGNNTEETGSNFNFNNLTEKIGLFTFNNPSRLTPQDGTKYIPSEESGNALASNTKENKVLQYMLESSGADLTDEMAELIYAQRAYQVSARVLQTADENEQTINSLRR